MTLIKLCINIKPRRKLFTLPRFFYLYWLKYKIKYLMGIVAIGMIVASSISVNIFKN